MTLAAQAEVENLKAPDKKLHTIRYDAPPPASLPDGVTVTTEPDEDDQPDENGLIYNEDGSVTVADMPKKKVGGGKKNFNNNLAETMDEMDLDILASELLEAIEDDIRSRQEWSETFSRGIDLLGLKIETPTSEVTGGGNIAKVKDPLLLEAVLTYQSNFNAEMLPADGPVKVRDDKIQVPPPSTPPGSIPGTAAASPAGIPGIGHNGGPPLEGPPPGAMPQASGPPVSPPGMAAGGTVGDTVPWMFTHHLDASSTTGMNAPQADMNLPQSDPGLSHGENENNSAAGIKEDAAQAYKNHGSQRMALGGVAAPINGMAPPMNGPPPPMGGLAPPPGPVQPPISRAELADAFENDFNHYLTVVDKPYYPDTDRMSFSQGLGGCAFKKVYVDPIEERPISRFVMAQHLIVNNGASSLHDAKRITHHIPAMSHIVMRQMMDAGAYREVELSQPTSQPGTVDAKIAETEGRMARVDRPDDVDYNVFECYCYRVLPGDEQKKNRPVPYRVSIEKDSRKVLEVRRNWKQGDTNFKPRRRFVKFSLFPGLGFYDYGFVHILGNTTRVLSAIESLMVDQGMFANFPGGMIDKMAAKQETNQIRPGPGGFKPIDTGGRNINTVVMPMPYKDVSANLMALAKGIQDGARKLGSIAELPIGEGRGDVPVGTVLALIEQAKVMESSVHRRNFAAQHEEFEILKELFAEDPQSLVKLAKNPARQWEIAEEFEDLDLIPMADPNTSSKVQRIGKATALLQILQQSPPGLLNPKEILTRAFKEMQLEDIDALFLPPPAPGSQPPAPHQLDAQAKAAQLQQKSQSDQMNAKIKLQIASMESNDKQQANQVQMALEADKLKIEAMKHVAEIQQGITPDNVPPPQS